MEDQLVTFETAKLAKEKGFDIKCDRAFWFNSTYHKDGEPVEIVSTGNIDKLKKSVNFEIGNPFVYRPTQSLLQRWLRQVYNLYVNYDVSPLTGNWEWFIHKLGYNETTGDLTTLIAESSSHYFLEPYDALEVGLQEALKQIKI
jgi:hypothetical protein